MYCCVQLGNERFDSVLLSGTSVLGEDPQRFDAGDVEAVLSARWGCST